MTSVLNVDTIADKAGTGPVALTKQEAPKFWLSMDVVNNVIEGSLNASTYTGEGTGEGTISITNSFSSQHDRCVLTGLYNSHDDGSNATAGASRGLSNVNVGASDTGDIDPLAAGSIQITAATGGKSNADGAKTDFSKVWLAAIGGLA